MPAGAASAYRAISGAILPRRKARPSDPIPVSCNQHRRPRRLPSQMLPSGISPGIATCVFLRSGLRRALSYERVTEGIPNLSSAHGSRSGTIALPHIAHFLIDAWPIEFRIGTKGDIEQVVAMIPMVTFGTNAVALSYLIEPGVRVQKVTLAEETPVRSVCSHDLPPWFLRTRARIGIERVPLVVPFINHRRRPKPDKKILLPFSAVGHV